MRINLSTLILFVLVAGSPMNAGVAAASESVQPIAASSPATSATTTPASASAKPMPPVTAVTTKDNSSVSDVILANDKLNIRVFREKELTAEWNGGLAVGYAVDAAGYLNFPMIGSIYVQGLTLEQLRVKLANLLDKFLVNPELNISFFDKKIKQQATIMGQVNKPGNYEYTNRMSIVRLVAEAGGFSKSIDTQDVRRRAILPDSKHVQITHLGGGVNGKTDIVDVDAIVAGNAPDVQLEPSDLVFVPVLPLVNDQGETAAQTVSVLGQVGRPGNYDIILTGTLVRLISEASGFTRLAATNRVKLTRKTETGQFTQNINAAAITAGQAEDVPLQAGDMIFVPESNF